MTDIEIDKALALAIGWEPEQMREGRINPMILMVQRREGCSAWPFSHKDWNVIGPIAERYDCFPSNLQPQGWRSSARCCCVYADTPQKAIALAVIGAKK